jgi:cytochrome P450
MSSLDRAQRKAEEALVHIPGEFGPDAAGATYRMMGEPLAFMRESIGKYGHVYKVRTILDSYVAMLGPDALEFVLQSQKTVFSSEQGWKPNLEKLFPGAVMMMDAPGHRVHRKLMAEAFKPPALAGYMPGVVAAITEAVDGWRREDGVDLYSGVKQLFLGISLHTFFGVTGGDDIVWLSRDMQALTAAVVFPAKRVLPFSKFWYVLQGRKRVARFIKRLINEKRKSADASMLSRFCHARTDEAFVYGDLDIVNHMLFMIMASHDTTTSLATSLTLLLASNPAWADQVADEASAVDINDTAALVRLPMLDQVFRETMRLLPPVPAIPRVAVQDIAYGKVIIPKGARVAVYPFYNHRDARYWANPDAFDPTRFARKEDAQHKYLFTPFGTGPHTCLGLVFAECVVKTFTAIMLRHRISSTRPVSAADFGIFPFPHPPAEVRVALKPR